MDVATFYALNVEGLRGKLRELGLVTTGRKHDLRGRLLEHFHLEGDDIPESHDSGSDTTLRSTVSVRTTPMIRSNFTLRDVEESLSPFCGSGSPDVDQWVAEFEDNAEN